MPSDKISIQHGSVFPIHLRVDDESQMAPLTVSMPIRMTVNGAKKIIEDLTWAVERVTEKRIQTIKGIPESRPNV